VFGLLTLLATALVAAPAAAGAPTAAPAPAAVLRLPAPTGPYAVGRDVLHLVDPGRADPWVPTVRRELMVSLYYPARRGTGTPAPYASTAEVAQTLAAQGLPIPPEALSTARTNARDHAARLPGRWPLVVLSPGFGAPRWTLTALAEDLTSRGYAVASIDHAYEAAGAAFPRGILPCVACTAARTAADLRRATAGRGVDVSFAIDELVRRFPAMLDRRRIGMAGHSLGGAAAVSAMVRDRRVLAGVNLDGAFGDPVPANGLDHRPFLLLGTDDAVHRPGGTDRTWDLAWQRLDGPKRWLTVAGTDHLSFSDLPVFASQLSLGGTERPVVITRAYVAAFLDRWLRHRPRRLLAGPSPAFPEVVFQHP
jgi:predicted dienelactone hydrolase